MRALLRHPIVNRAAQCLIQAVAAHKWKVKTEDNERAEEWINLVMDDIGDRMIRKAVDGVLFGHQEGEVYFPYKVDNLWWPAVAYPPQDYITLRVDENWKYAGYRQKSPDGKPDAVVSSDESVLWTWGDWGGNPYGLGLLELVYAYAQNHTIIMDQITTMAKRQNWPFGVIGIPGDGRASQSSIDEFSQDIAALPEKEVPIAAYKQYSQNPITLSVIQPVRGAMEEASAAAMDLVRMIAAGMLTPLRIFFSPGDEGGSYNLVEVQMSEHDRMVTGIWNSILPGVNDLIGLFLKENFGDVDYTFDLEYIDEQSLRAARDTLNEMLRGGTGVESVDIPALMDMAGIPALADDQAPASSTDTVGARSRATGDKARILALARRVKKELDNYYKNNKDRLIDRLLGVTNPKGLVQDAVTGAIGNAKRVYTSMLGELPVLPGRIERDWSDFPRRLAAGYIRSLEGILKDLDSMKLRYGEDYVTGKWEKQHRNQAAKLADRALKAGHYYMGDLQRGKNMDSDA